MTFLRPSCTILKIWTSHQLIITVFFIVLSFFCNIFIISNIEFVKWIKNFLFCSCLYDCQQQTAKLLLAKCQWFEVLTLKLEQLIRSAVNQYHETYFFKLLDSAIIKNGHLSMNERGFIKSSSLFHILALLIEVCKAAAYKHRIKSS